MHSVGVQVKRLHDHTSSITDICFDNEAEYIASCSQGGVVTVSTVVGRLQPRYRKLPD